MLFLYVVDPLIRLKFYATGVDLPTTTTTQWLSCILFLEARPRPESYATYLML